KEAIHDCADADDADLAERVRHARSLGAEHDDLVAKRAAELVLVRGLPDAPERSAANDGPRDHASRRYRMAGGRRRRAGNVGLARHASEDISIQVQWPGAWSLRDRCEDVEG